MGLKDRSRVRIRRATVCLAAAVLLGAPGLPGLVTAAAASTPAPIPSLTVYSVPSLSVNAKTGLAAGPDGNMWLRFTKNSITRVTPAGVVQSFPIPSFFVANGAITAGPDGNVWFPQGTKIYRMSPDGTVTGAFVVPSGSPGLVTAGSDGNVWFTESQGVSRGVGFVTPSGQMSEFDVSQTGPLTPRLTSIAAGADGNLWFADHANNHVGRVTPAGEITTFNPPATSKDQVQWMATGPDGNVWFTVPGDGIVGKVTPSGTFTQYFVPAGTLPYEITSGPDGALWFEDPQNSQVGRMTVDGQVGLASTPFEPQGYFNRPQNITKGPDGRLWMVLKDPPVSLAAFPPFVPSPSQPDIRSITPPDGTAKGGTTVVITGYDVGFATQVLFGNTPATSFTPLGPGQVQAVVPAHAADEVDVTVVTPYGTTQPSAGSKFFISSPDCGMVVTKNTTLRSDLGPCYHDGVVVAANGVQLSLGGHRVFGFPEPSDGHSAGIRLPGRSNVKIVGGTVSGFDAGVVIRGGGSNSVSGLIVKDNIGLDDVTNTEFGDGIFISASSGNKITGNTISHNGHFDGIGVFDPGSDGNTITGNVVEDTLGPGNQGPAGEGIIVNGSSGGQVSTFIQGTKIAGNTVRNNGGGGISNTNHVGGVISDNRVTGNGTTNSFGNGIGVTVGFVWDLGPTNMVIKRNEVHGNGVDGIRIGSLNGFGIGAATGNSIVNNNAADNGKNLAVDGIEGAIMAYDLHEFDGTPGCQNQWSSNTWGSAFYSPDCTANGGHGPTPPAAVTATAAPATAASLATPGDSGMPSPGPTADDWWAFLQGGR